MARFTAPIERVVAKDKYTVEFKFKEATPWSNFMAVLESIVQPYEAPEVVKLAKDDPARAIGTGPFIFSELVRNTSMTLVKNPDYWNYDERYSQNRLPYVDGYKILAIPDMVTAIAALRTGKIDQLSNIDWQRAQTMAKTNPELVQTAVPFNAMTLDMRNDKKPFTDIRVRKALQMAINIPEIVKGYYAGNALDVPVGLINPAMKGYSVPFQDWPQNLKDEYTFNPEAAKKLLADAGYPNGFKTNIVVGTGEGDIKLLEVVKSYLADINVDMEIRAMELVAEQNFVGALKHDQMAAIFSAGLTMPPNISVGTRSITDQRNLARNNDPVYEDLFAQMSKAATTEDAERIAQAADQRFSEQHWVLVTPAMQTYNVWQPYLKGYEGEGGGGPGGGMNQFYLSRLWVEK